MSVTIILQAPNTATITHTGAVSATITQSGAVSATIQQVVGQGVSVQNIVPNSVTINTGGASGGGSWGSITGEITDQTDLVTYVAAERQSYAIESPDGTSFIIVAGNDGTLAAIPPTSTAPSITTLPTISGTLEVGETLTATAGNVSGEPTPTRVLQWQRSDNGTTGWADISGATGTTYLLGFNDEDKYIRVAQTEENILGTATANSASTGQIQPVAFVGLLDDYPNAAAAYSLRKLRNLYTGDAIIVRRASDNATQSIGFSGDELDTASLESFCSGTDGFVTTWYDQSGNGNDVANGTASSQPQIVSSGTTLTQGGKPSVSFSNKYLTRSNLVYTTNVLFATSVFSSIDSTGVLLGQNSGTAGRSGPLEIGAQKAKYFFNNGASFENFSSNLITLNEQTLMTNYSFDNDYYSSLNGNAGNNQITNQVFTPSAAGVSIGATYSATNYLSGTIQEIVVWNSDKSSNKSGIETNINAFYTIY